MSDKLQSLTAHAKARQEENRALAGALDEKLNVEGSLFAHRVNMGIVKSESGIAKLVPSYVSVLSLDEVASKIYMGSDMPFMKNKLDKKTGKIIVDEENINQIMQRAPDWTRQINIAAYLLANTYHKFTSVLAVIEPDWINDPTHNNWGDDNRALVNSIEFTALDTAGKIGLINLKDVSIFALDGQHRIMGIAGIKDLYANKLSHKTKNGKAKGELISSDQFFKEIKIEPVNLRKILNETMGVEFIPAVIKGETREEARRRLRSYFVSINTYAKKISEGESRLLSEDDGYQIVAKDLVLTHPLFKVPGKDDKHRVNMSDNNLGDSIDSWITTLIAITIMSENYLSQNDNVRGNNWNSILDGKVKLRPNEDEIVKAVKEFKEFLDMTSKLTVFQKLSRGIKPSKLRMFPKEKKGHEDNEGHLLMRPIGQQILADAVGKIVGQGNSLDDIFKKLEKLEDKGHFNTHKPQSIFYGVTYNIEKGTVIHDSAAQKFAAQLLSYLLHENLEITDLEKLMSKVVDKRTVPMEEDKWFNFEGERVSKSNIDYNQLPVRA